MKAATLLTALRDPRRWKRWALEALILAALVAAITVWQNSGLASGKHAASLAAGTIGVLHGTRSYQPRSQQELDQIATLVRSAIGYDEKGTELVRVPVREPSVVRDYFDRVHDAYLHNIT